jgi:hypothetical protein
MTHFPADCANFIADCTNFFFFIKKSVQFAIIFAQSAKNYIMIFFYKAKTCPSNEVGINEICCFFKKTGFPKAENGAN